MPLAGLLSMSYTGEALSGKDRATLIINTAMKTGSHNYHLKTANQLSV